MQSRRDQVQAHLFVMSRVSSGMLRGEPDAPDTPIARTTRGAVIGLAIAMLIGLVVGVYGLIVPGGATGWQKPGTLVLVKETGARYLYAGGALHPVLNQASAKLLAGDQLTLQQVSVQSLAGAPRGGPVGLVGAPDGLPTADQLGRSDWLACVVQGAPGGRSGPQLALSIGLRGTGRRLADAQGVLVSAPDGTAFLLWHGLRLKLDAGSEARRALGFAASAPVPVTAGFLNAVPVGPELTAPEIRGRGTAGPVLAGRPSRLGQLFAGPGEERYVLTQDGLAPLSGTMLALVQGDPRTQKEAYGGDAVNLGQVGPADLSAHTAPAPAAAAWAGADLPAVPPQPAPAGPGQAVCAELRPGSGAPALGVSVLDAAAVAGQGAAPQPGVAPACAGADRIAVRPGGGALVRAVTGSGFGSTLYLVTDAGVKYPLPSAAAAKQLGYEKVAPDAVPGTLLGLLPTGPSLDPTLLASGGIVTQPAAPDPCKG
ncbi:type VII secretion protein EccB [Kitasatospora sp. NPDC049258]|uniref:type VII secretion protein EccB n=1 Tax=Kitasatospora sp. NPDC049258 TaxID=3155394 RepID=UPI00343C4AB1